MVRSEDVGRDFLLESKVDWIIPGIGFLIGDPFVDLLGEI